MVVRGYTTDELKVATKTTLQEISGWMKSNGLKLETHKAEAIMLNRKRNFDFPIIQTNGYNKTVGRHLNYLGITRDSPLTFHRYQEDAQEGPAG